MKNNAQATAEDGHHAHPRADRQEPKGDLGRFPSITKKTGSETDRESERPTQPSYDGHERRECPPTATTSGMSIGYFIGLLPSAVREPRTMALANVLQHIVLIQTGR